MHVMIVIPVRDHAIHATSVILHVITARLVKEHVTLYANYVMLHVSPVILAKLVARHVRLVIAWTRENV